MNKQTLSYREISALCLELSLFLHAGADCSSGLVLLAEETQIPWLKQALLEMADRMDMDKPLSDAMEHSQLFPGDVYNMVRVGERTGRTEDALRSLSAFYDSRDAADRQLRSALLYPSVLMLVMLTVIIALLTKVLPIFNDVYASLGGQLTGLAGGLLRLGSWIDAALPVVCLLLAAAVGALIVFSCSQEVRTRLLAVLRKRGGSRGISRRMDTARFAQALSMALCSGLTAEEAIESAALLLEEQPDAAERCRKCTERLANGEPFADVLRSAELLPAAECRLLTLGLASGSGEAAAEEIARRLERDAEEALEHRIGLVEPVMVVVTSLLVGMILLAVMLPLSNIMTAIG